MVSRSVRLLTSARRASLPPPSASLPACSVPSFKPQMATRAPSLSNSCAAASPIPLLPPVIRIFLFASLPIVVTPLDYVCPWRLQPPANSADAAYQLRETRSAKSRLNGGVTFERRFAQCLTARSFALWSSCHDADHTGNRPITSGL